MPALPSSKPHTEIVYATAIVVLMMLVAMSLYWAKAVLAPLALAVLMTFVLSPVTGALQRRHVPRLPAILITVGSMVVLAGALGWMFVAQFLHFANRLPEYQDSVARRIAELRREGRVSLLGKVQDFVEHVSAAATTPLEPASTDADAPQPVKVVGGIPNWNFAPLVSNAGGLAEFLATSGLVIVLVILMLLHQEDIRNRLIRLFGAGRMTLTTKALDDAERRISRFLFVQFAVNSLCGLIVGIGLWILGLPYAVLWGVIAAFLRYIPYLGPWIAILGPLALSLLTAEGWGQPIAVLLLYVCLETGVGLLLEPWLYGQSIGVSQAGLLVAITFWSWLWGATGLILAPPLTVCLVVLGKHVQGLKFFDIILGDAPLLSAAELFYQRLLVRDQDEASDLVRRELQSATGTQVADTILIPSLVGARRELESGRLTEADVESMQRAILEICEEQGLGKTSAPEETEPAESSLRLAESEIVACPARDGVDETALDLFSTLVDSQLMRIDRISSHRMISEIVARIDALRASVVCIVALPPGGLAPTRLLCKRLRSRYPELKIVVGRWGIEGFPDSDKDLLRQAGAEYFGTSLGETVAQLVQLSRCSPARAVSTAFAAAAENAHSVHAV